MNDPNLCKAGCQSHNMSRQTTKTTGVLPFCELVITIFNGVFFCVFNFTFFIVNNTTDEKNAVFLLRSLAT